MQNAGTHGLQNAKMLNFLFNNIRNLSEQKYSLFCTFDVSLDNINVHIERMFGKTISHEWVRQIYLDSAVKR